MRLQFRVRLWGLIIYLLLGTVGIIAQGENLALTTANLNGRAGSDVTYDIVTKYPYGSTVSVTARNEVGDWLYVRGVDTGIEAWVTSVYLSLPDTLNVMSLPVRGVSAVVVAQTSAEQVSDEPVALAPAEQVINSGSGLGETITNVNVRTAPSAGSTLVVLLSAETKVAIESRNRIGNWIIIRTPDGVFRGWAASRYIDFGEGVALEALPISTEIMSLTGETVQSDFNPVIGLPEGDANQLRARLDSIPLLHNFGSGRVYSTFQLGKEKGNRPNVFMKVGDSVTALQPYLYAYGEGGGYDLGNYGYLQNTINYFIGTSPREGVANAFTNRGFAAITGATSASMLDSIWSDPNFCNGQPPLLCEINLTRPSVGLVLFGTQDMRVLQPFEFRIHMAQLVETMMFNGVIPVLSTFHNNPAYYSDEALIFNNIIIDVAEQYDVPIINLWKATQPLPNNGTDPVDPVHLTQGVDNYYNFTGEENLYGVNMRNLLSLQALDQLRQNVLLR